MSSSEQSNTHIARNTFMLYIRMGVSMVVGLFTSRVILSTLGVEDFGIYGVVGSVLGMLNFLNSAMAGATSRFITFEIGRGDKEALAATFSTAFIIHVCIAVVMLVVAETAGLWFLNNKLVIPPDRMVAANWVYQFCVASAMITITQVPYNAALIAHERMDVYAYVEMVNTLLKLAIVYLLYIGSMDRLIQYGIQMMLVSAGVAVFYRYYAIRHFEEAKLRFLFSKDIFRRMGAYTVYGLFSSSAVLAKRNGIVMLVNMFFGVAVNAAASLAATVSGVIQGFASNVLTAIRPPLVAYYAQNNREAFLKLLYSSVVVMVFVMSASAVPFIIEMDYILDLWLEEVPEWTASMCRISLLGASVIMAETVVNIANSANGNIRRQSIFSGVALLAQLPIAYLLFRLFYNPLMGEAVSAVFSLLMLFMSTSCVKRNIPYISVRKVISSALKAFLLCCVVGLPIAYVQHFFQPSFVRLITVFVLYEMLALPLGYKLLFDDTMRNEVKGMWNRLRKKKKD